MLTTFNAMLPYLMPDVPGCPENMALHALRAAAREFCGRTELWKKELVEIDVVADQQLYSLDPDVTAGVEPEIRRIDKVKLYGALMPIDRYDLVEYTSGTPATAQSLRWDDAHIPATAAVDGLIVTAILVPDWATDALPDILMTRWGDGIVAKAAFDLLTLDRKSVV